MIILLKPTFFARIVKQEIISSSSIQNFMQDSKENNFV